MEKLAQDSPMADPALEPRSGCCSLHILNYPAVLSCPCHASDDPWSNSFLIINFHMCLSIYLWSIPPILSLYMSTHAIGSVSLENPNMTNRFLLGFSTRNDEGHDVVRSRSEKWKKLKREVRMSQDHEEDSHTWEAAVNPSSRKQQVQRHQCVWTGRTERSSVADGGCACS